MDASERASLREVAAETASDVGIFLNTVRRVAAGHEQDTAISVLLLAMAQVIGTGARLGALADVVPEHRFEPDVSNDPDIEPVHAGLQQLLDGIDEYVEVCDPLVDPEVVGGRISDDVAEIVAALAHGVRHFERGDVVEALWWWQFSYLSAWGDRAVSAMRALQSVLSHVRLDADEEVVADATFEALHA